MTSTWKLADPTSPNRLALYSYGVFLVAWFFPPNFYTSVLNEPDLMFLNPLLFVFFTACTLAFVLGVGGATWIFGNVDRTKEPLARVASPLKLCLPVALCTLWAIAYIRDVGAHINVAALLLSQQGGLIKESSSSLDLSSGRLALSVPFLTAALFWSYTRYKQQKPRLIGGRPLFIVTFLVGFLVLIAICLALVDRGTLMSLIIGMTILSIHNRFVAGKLNRKKLILVGCAVVLGISMIFVIFSILRGSNSYQLVLWTFIGYSIASYNRLAAVLSGLIVSPFPGKPVHLVYYLIESIRLEDIFHFRQALNWPDAYSLFQAEFSEIYASGLNASFIWLGVFGDIYTDIEWLAPFFIFGVGFITGLAWVLFRRRNVVGLVLYPWFAFSIVFWIGASLVFNDTFVYLVEAALALSLYEALFFRTAIVEPDGVRLARGHLVESNTQ